MDKYDHPDDPRGLIFEAYHMDLNLADCRTVLFDWATGHNQVAGAEQIKRLFDHYVTLYPDHPMTRVLGEGMPEAAAPRRRGGRQGRLNPER